MRVPVGGGHVQLRLDLLRDALVVRNSFEMRSELTEFYGVRFDGVQVEGNRLDGVRVDSVRLKGVDWNLIRIVKRFHKVVGGTKKRENRISFLCKRSRIGKVIRTSLGRTSN